jgi:hypothetical protein
LTDEFCRELSLVAGEPLAGSAVHVHTWIVLEVREPWEKKHLPGSTLSNEVKERIERWLDEIPQSRLQFIRRPAGEGAPPLAFFVARSDVAEPWLLRFEMATYPQLLGIDLPEVLRTGIHVRGSRVHEPLYLVCCHGKRDRCCAKWGVALHDTVCDAAPDRTWQTTHLGGHRFAATMVVLPHGICYGRLEGGEGPEIVTAHERGEVYDPSRMRGRSAYEPAAQAAEIELRRRLGDRTLAGQRLHGTELVDAGTRVRFATPDGAEHVVDVTEIRIAGERPTSCGDEPSAIEGLRVLG